uniref:BTB domain-containing protein n=1 Tax=Mycena chlorophos TaxID=658473 RepID=A0ABQ0L2W7_MYCCL|nr:predicted protein [Mycena chlorophos]
MQVLGGTPAHLLRVWLDRSADLPLEVNLSFREGGSFAAHAILMTQASRWRHTELVLQSIPRLFRGKTLEMPLLKYFGFVDLYHNNEWAFDDEDSDSDEEEDNHTDENDADDRIIPIRFSAPNLETLFYTSVDFLRSELQISPSTWANIVNLMLNQVDVNSALAILVKTKRIRHLHIEELTFDDDLFKSFTQGQAPLAGDTHHPQPNFPLAIIAEALQNLALSEGLLIRSGPNDSETKPEVETLADLLRSWGCAPRIVHITCVDDTHTKEYYQDSGLPLAVDCEMHVREEDAALDEPAMPESLWRTWSGVHVNGTFWYL